MIKTYVFTKREPVRLKFQGEGIFEYKKLMITKDGNPMCALNFNEARELRDALLLALPQGVLLSDLNIVD